MADVEMKRTVRGRKVSDYVVELPGTAAALRRMTFELQAYAEVNLEEARSVSLFIGRQFDENARIEVEQTNRRRNEWAVILDDSDRTGDGRQEAAGNIEKGRRDYFRRDTGQPYGGMEGLFILQRAIQALKDRHRRSLRG